jgi:hypothetical protein
LRALAAFCWAKHYFMMEWQQCNPSLITLRHFASRRLSTTLSDPSCTPPALPPKGVGHCLTSCCHCGLDSSHHFDSITPCRCTQGVKLQMGMAYGHTGSAGAKSGCQGRGQDSAAEVAPAAGILKLQLSSWVNTGLS